MPLDRVLQEIQQKGEEEVRKIREEAEKEVEKILARAKAEAEEILKKAREEAEKEAEALRKQEISSVKLEMKRELLNVQKEILEDVFNLLRQKIRDMDVDTRKKLLKTLLEKNASAGMVVYSRKEDEEIVKELIKDMKLDVKYGGNIECIGGIVLEDATGDVRINMTFDELVSQIYEQKMSEVSKLLFK
ncbi:V-type ATP synthase subunit E [Archaeoglobus neptunius]|uniref:V-type ATP synthase subunit E n=1 Tax=Archaeoglobus neptunius TaxID=2798580 RepID=UPI0019289DD9|nr:V-type ATP synthase subunit E [Archaeoglobus neptunius]